MTEKRLCRDCKYLEHDGMAGIWCGVRGNNTNYDCPKFERKRLNGEKRFTIIDGVKKGTHSGIWDKQKQNNQRIGDELWLGEVVAMLNEGVMIAEENEQLKQEKDKWKQQCIHFKEMLDDMDIAYLCDEWIYEELKDDKR